MAQRNAASEDACTAFQDFVLAARIEGEFALEPATAHLEVEARVSDGFVKLQGRVRVPDEIDAVTAVANFVRGVKRVDSKNVRLMPLAADFPMLASVRAKEPIQVRFWLPGFAGIAAIALLAFGLLHLGTGIGGIKHGTGNSLQVFAGVVTDTVCAGTSDPLNVCERASIAPA